MAVEPQLNGLNLSVKSPSMENVESSTSRQTSTASLYHASLMASSGVQADAQCALSSRPGPPIPPQQVLSMTLNLFFNCWHNQPYCFFHRETFQQQLWRDELPKYLIRAVLCIAIRFSDDPFYVTNGHTAAEYALAAWKDIVQRTFDAEEAMDYRLVQAATLLALYDFTACKHRTAWIKIGVAVNVAQALHLMKEPPTSLPFSAQEERRRTLWSIYLLDKLATCGRHRPSLFLDRTIRLQLPCSEDSFETSSPQQVVTLEDFPHLIDSHVEHMETLAPTVVGASLLSQVANYAFAQNMTGDQKAPWDHTSEYQAICSQLAQFETFFDCYGDIQEAILNRSIRELEPTVKITESTVFAYVLYHLCYCLLQHPFLIRRRLEVNGFKTSAGFLARTLVSCSAHAQELTRTLNNATNAQYKASGTFLSYCSLVAGSIHCLFQHSPDCLTSVQSVEALQSSIMHINEKAKLWKTSVRMVTELTQFSIDSIRYSGLLDPSLQSVPLEPADIEKLYALCDYGTMATFQNVDSTNAATTDTGYSDSILEYERGSEIEPEDFSGHIDGIIPQFFGLTDTNAMIDNISFALEGRVEGVDRNNPTRHLWRF